VLYVRTIVEQAARASLEAEASKYDGVPSYAANFARLGFAAIDATIADPAGLAAYADARRRHVDEIVLRAITPSAPAASLQELEAFVEHAATWMPAGRA